MQTASGFNAAEAEASGAREPKPLPAQALDHATGYLMAFAAISALARRTGRGGSWHVRASLAQTGYWIRCKPLIVWPWCISGFIMDDSDNDVTGLVPA